MRKKNLASSVIPRCAARQSACVHTCLYVPSPSGRSSHK